MDQICSANTIGDDNPMKGTSYGLEKFNVDAGENLPTHVQLFILTKINK